MIFTQTDEVLKKYGAFHTTKEIYQQPAWWKKIADALLEKEGEWKSFVEPIYDKFDSVRVLFTGAGSSAFIGEVLVPALNMNKNRKHVRFEAIATTDIVSNPTEFLNSYEPTILVSFARSGNSPESVATQELAEKIVKDIYHVVVTCNKDGKLAQKAKDDNKSYLILLPDEVNDRSFAMTSSFTSMLLAAYQLFSEEFSIETIHHLAGQASRLLSDFDEVTKEILQFDFERIVYLGSGSLGKLTREAALKMLELTNGQVASIFESSLGFRHGPKTFLNEKTLVILYMSHDEYTEQYDIDILKEISGGNHPLKTVVLSEKKDYSQWANWSITVNSDKEKFDNDLYLALLYILFAQTLALKKSLQLEISPDNPVPDGSVNRVVKGVTIYPFETK